jgi:subtilisin-like proprotein convertase family protein
MDAKSGLRRIFSFLLIFAALCPPVFAGPTVIYGGDFNLPILDRQEWGSPLTEAVITVPHHFTIYDLDVAINIKHTNVFDLQIFIQSPDETMICLNMYDLESDFFKGENYMQTIFDDEAEISIEEGLAPFTGRFRPEAGNLLQMFDGKDAYGNWSFRIYDLWFWDTGSLESGELIFSVSEPDVIISEPAAMTLLALGVGLITVFRRRRA